MPNLFVLPQTHWGMRWETMSHLIQGKLWLLHRSFPFSPSTPLAKWTLLHSIQIATGDGLDDKSLNPLRQRRELKVFLARNIVQVGNENDKIVRTKKREMFHETSFIFKAVWNSYYVSYSFADKMGFNRWSWQALGHIYTSLETLS